MGNLISAASGQVSFHSDQAILEANAKGQGLLKFPHLIFKHIFIFALLGTTFFLKLEFLPILT